MGHNIDLPIGFIEAVRRLRDIPIDVLAADPGGSTGVCFLGHDGQVASAQGRVDEVGAFVEVVLGGTARVPFYLREGTAMRSTEAMVASHTGPESVWKQGYNSGVIDEKTRRWLRDDVAVWTPGATTWRSLLKLNRKRNGKRTSREETNDAVVEWAEQKLGRPIRRESGLPAFDEANAVAMAYAMRIAINSIRSSR